MNTLKKYLSVLLILSLTLSAFTACSKKEEAAAVTEAVPAQIQEIAETQAAEEQTAEEQAVSTGFYQVGDKIDDFTITTHDGREVSLYKVLEEKDMVLLNLWATWCGPCASEFPAMQEAYEQYQDKVEIIAISTESTDSDEVLSDYVQEMGMTFCVAGDKIGLDSRFYHNYIPASVVVDRFGTICLMEEGAVPDAAVFTNLFDIYTADDYTESVLLTSIYAEKPDIQPADPAALNEALNGEGGNLVFSNSSNAYYWPMTVEQKDGRTVAFASNSLHSRSKAVVETQVDVKTGDVLVMEYKLENNVSQNMLNLKVDGKTVKETGLNKDWTTYAYRFEEAGNHRVSVSFDINQLYIDNYSNLWIDSIRVVSGDEAAKALENNPKYPVGEQNQIQLLNENAKLALAYYESTPDEKSPVYFCSDSTLRLLVTLDETVDPENAILADLNNNGYSVVSHVTEDGFVVEVPNSKPEELLGNFSLRCNNINYAGIDVFLSEEQAARFADLAREQLGAVLKWEYADEAPDVQNASGNVTYTVTYLDQHGNAVPGVMCQVCDESTCQVFVSDDNGVCRFTLPAKAYEIHTLKVPAGYEGDTTTITEAPAGGGELTFTLTKK